eukprot:9270459-Alexandrium_andersonii.AAC.1
MEMGNRYLDPGREFALEMGCRIADDRDCSNIFSSISSSHISSAQPGTPPRHPLEERREGGVAQVSRTVRTTEDQTYTLVALSIACLRMGTRGGISALTSLMASAEVIALNVESPETPGLGRQPEEEEVELVVQRPKNRGMSVEQTRAMLGRTSEQERVVDRQ